MVANQLLAVLNNAKQNQIDVKITELDNGEIGCTCSCGTEDETFTCDSLEYLVRRISMIVEDWKII